MKEYINRLKSVQKQLGAKDILLLFGAELKTRNSDVDYKFRQNSDFYYLTAFNEPGAILAVTSSFTAMFVPAKDKEKEIWTGVRAGKDKIKKDLKLSASFDNEDWDNEKENLLIDKDTLYYFFGDNADRDRELLQICHTLNRKIRDGRKAPSRIIRPDFLHEDRLKKSNFEIEKIKEAARITAIGHDALFRNIYPGMMEFEAEAILEKEYLSAGAWGGGYGHIVASGENATILHYTANNRKMEDGDLILVDSGAEKDGYTADVTRTFPVGKKFTQAQKEIYSLVLETQKKVIHQAVKGNTMAALHHLAVKSLTNGLLELGLLKGSLEKNIQEKKYAKFYMHKTGHWLGMDVHDVGSYFHDGKARKLEDGMVLTVEPGLYFAVDDQSIPSRYRGIGVRIEDNILISGKKPINLTLMIPKEIDDLEQLRNRL